MTYKFRGFDKVGSKGWVYGDLTHTKGLDNKIPELLYDRVMVGGYEVYPESVGIFTGLYDEQRKEIYEGDMLSVWSFDDYWMTIVYNEKKAAFVWKDDRGGQHTIRDNEPTNSRIITNIFENGFSRTAQEG